MAIQFQCPSCRSTLRVPDYLSGRKVRCPKCRGVADVVSTPMSVASAAGQALAQAKSSPAPAPQPIPGPDEGRIRARKPSPPPEPDIEDAEEVEEQPVKPARSRSRREEAISTRPVRHNDTDTDDEEEDELPRPRRFKRHRHRPTKQRSSPPSWGFLWYLVVGLIYLGVGAGVSYYKIATGEVFELIISAIGWAVLMPISVILLIASMMIASAIAGGIDFGDIWTAIPKAFFLLAPINFISIICPWYVSYLFTPVFWMFGLIILYGLDLWETFFLMIVNCFLSLGAKVLVFLIVIAMIHGAQMDKEKDSSDNPGDELIGAPFQKDPPKTRLRR